MLKRPLTSSLLPLLLLCLAACSGAPELSPTPAPSPITDGDEDGYAAASEGGDDCNDNHAEVHPGAAEQCNGLDDDCDGATDEGFPTSRFYTDADGDGYGDAASPVDACVAPPGTVSNGSDCDDGNAQLNPGILEQCDGIDQDCDGEVDEDVVRIYYVDADGDGYGNGEAASPVEACVAPPGSVSNGSDCDDDNPSIHPAAVEVCDGLDQDCDGEVDEELAQTTHYPDADGDGYGETGGATQQGCAPGLVSNQLDCNDEDASSYPAAPDTAGDGIDQSCDGTDGLAPSVGLPGSTFTTIQAALDAASDGQTVWVGPGTYNEYGLNMQGKALRLASTAGQETTILDGMGMRLGTVFYFDSAETETSSVEGFTITGGAASCNTPTGDTICYYDGGGMFLDGSSPTLSNVTFTENTALGGGGMYLNNSSPTLNNVTFTGNTAEYGGGMRLSSSSPTLNNVTFTGNTASYGGGMYLSYSSPTLSNVTFTGNEASGDNAYDGYGGGMYLDESSPTLSNVTFTGNTAYDGGGMSLYESSPTLSNVTFTGNRAYDGGGMYLDYSSPTLSNVTFTGNTAKDDGGGMYLDYSSPTLKNVTFTGNTADYGGGGMRLYYGSSPTLSNVTFTGNTAGYYGGGMDLYESSPTLSNVTFTGNTASSYGGGMDLDESSPTLSNVTFTGNTADYGGGMFLSGSSPTLKNVTFTGNTADSGGGMYLDYSFPTLKNVILAYNRASSGGNFYTDDFSSSVNATTSLFYNPSGWGTDNLTSTGTYLTVEPQFLDYADTRSGAPCTPGTSTSCLPADLHPALGSPLINAGDPAMSDVDGSRADIGSYGGPGGGSWDVDADGAPDYFWPDEWDKAPSGFDPADYDCDDLDPDVQGC